MGFAIGDVFVYRYTRLAISSFGVSFVWRCIIDIFAQWNSVSPSAKYKCFRQMVW